MVSLLFLFCRLWEEEVWVGLRGAGGGGRGGGGGMVPTPTFAGSFIVPQTLVSHNFSVFPNVAFI